MPDEILIRFSVKDDGSPVIERVNKKIGETKKETTALVPGVEKARESLTGFVSQNAALIGILTAVGVALFKTFQDYAKYAEGVRDFSLVTGTSAEEASRFIQVLDDYQLSVEDATTASRFLKEKGLVPNIETLIDLSRQFKSIQDPAERLAFIQENLGRGGAKWVNVLNQSEDALRANAAAVNENLIMTDAQIAKYEQQRLALDALSDTVEGAKIKTGSFVGEVILQAQVEDRAKEILREKGIAIHVMTAATEDYELAIAQARQEQEAQSHAMTENSDAAKQNAEDIKALEEKQKALSETIGKQIDLINRVQSAEDSYTEKSKDLAGQRMETEAELAKVRAQGYWESSSQVQDQLAKLDEIKTKEAELAEERAKQALQFVSDILAQNLARDGWTKSELEAFGNQQLAWGLWSADVVEKAKAAWQEADKITASINAIPSNKDVMVNVHTIMIGGFAPGTPEYDRIAFAGRDAGGPGAAGMGYTIGQSARPEVFMPGQSGTFVPNADRTMIDYGRFARTLRDVLAGMGR